MTLNKMMELPPYGVEQREKDSMLLFRMNELTAFHRKNCQEYGRMLRNLEYTKEADSLEAIPMLPVQMFKKKTLSSVPEQHIYKTMTSSGTTGQQVSKIFLDKETASNQQKVLARIVSEFTGSSRMPMIILDCPSVIKDRAMFSARGAGILGFSIFGAKRIFALDDDMRLNVEGLKEFLETHKGKTVLLFGFTFMIWQYVYKELARLEIPLDLSNAVLIHGGGWKKLEAQKVSRDVFKQKLRGVCGIKEENIHDYYGMVEQTGCIYMECECGHLHASTYSEILIRNMRDFSLCRPMERGVIQVLSTLPESYPGHSILTEDEGMILGIDDCPCGRKGTYFEVFGRIKNAEVRGCSDTFEEASR